MQVTSEFHAYPQRWATGWERAVDDQGNELTGREVEVMMSATRMIRAESKETSFGPFASGDVKNYIVPIELYIDHLAAQTQTPVYYLKGKLANLSADAMHAADQGLVDRCKGKILTYSDPWEEYLRTAFLAVNDQKRGHAKSPRCSGPTPIEVARCRRAGRRADASVAERADRDGLGAARLEPAEDPPSARPDEPPAGRARRRREPAGAAARPQRRAGQPGRTRPSRTTPNRARTPRRPRRRRSPRTDKCSDRA